MSGRVIAGHDAPGQEQRYKERRNLTGRGAAATSVKAQVGTQSRTEANRCDESGLINLALHALPHNPGSTTLREKGRHSRKASCRRYRTAQLSSPAERARPHVPLQGASWVEDGSMCSEYLPRNVWGCYQACTHNLARLVGECTRRRDCCHPMSSRPQLSKASVLKFSSPRLTTLANFVRGFLDLTYPPSTGRRARAGYCRQEPRAYSSVIVTPPA